MLISTSDEEHVDGEIEMEMKVAKKEPIEGTIEGDERVHVLRSRLCKRKARLEKARIESTLVSSA